MYLRNLKESFEKDCNIGNGNRDHATSLKEGARSALFSNLSKSALDIYLVKCSQRPLLEEVA